MDEWSKTVAVIPKKFELLPGSFRLNIEYETQPLLLQELIEIVEPIGIGQIVRKHGGSYFEPITTKIPISRGETQRFGVARALVRKHLNLIILNNSIDGLDTAAQRQMLQALRDRHPKAIIIFVSHVKSIQDWAHESLDLSDYKP